MERTILHVDLDAFYAAVEVRENPALAGQPVIVGADPRGGRGRGVVAAASYEARHFGVHSAMPISQAYRRCPHAVFVRPRMDLYGDVSGRFMGILRRYSDLVEPISIDEAFIDASHSRALFGDGRSIARRIKDDVRREERLTASIGVAPTKFVAKIASDVGKPDGLLVVAADEVEGFLGPLPVTRLWGAGRKTVTRFARLGVVSIGDVARVQLSTLESAFGQALGRHFHDLACGRDPRGVEPDRERKSIGRERTFSHDVDDRAQVERTLLELLEELTRRLRRLDVPARAVTVKLRTADFSTVTRQAALRDHAETTEVIWPVARRLLAKADLAAQPIRLIGISLTVADPAAQLALFEDPVSARQRRVARAIDSVTARFGPDAIRRAGALALTNRATRRR